MRDSKHSYRTQYPIGGGKYLDPKADLTMSLLNSLLPLGPDEQIMELEFITQTKKTTLRQVAFKLAGSVSVS